MDNFCSACRKSIAFNYKLCPDCEQEYNKERSRFLPYTQDECYLEIFCLDKRNEQMSSTLEKVLDEKANLFMENLHLKEEIRQLLSGKGEEILNTMREKMEALSKGYEELNKRTMGLATCGGPKSSG